jgi:hypothetical protein
MKDFPSTAFSADGRRKKPRTFFSSSFVEFRAPWNSIIIIITAMTTAFGGFWSAASITSTTRYATEDGILCIQRAQKMWGETLDISQRADGKAEEGVVQNYRLLCSSSSSTTDNTKEYGNKK